ncbi:MAG: hypothetical protein KDD61_00440 [Bdellovibrionales bacterium]|nr:hypothetical protein [Bdellovibrionales bacterium]
MQRKPFPHLFLATIYVIGIFVSTIETRAQENEIQTNVEQDELVRESKEGWVEVEPTYVIPKTSERGFTLMPYSERRRNWSSLFGFSANFFTPLSYIPDQDIGTYEEVYGSQTNPMIMIEYTKKRNYSWGSFGYDFGVGFQTASSDSTESTLNLVFVEAGATIALDNMGQEPTFVPYVGGGAYIVAYKEALASSSFNGTTQVAPYAMGGLLIQLNRLDKESAIESYFEAGIENTYFFIEGRKYFPSTEKVDPNFETEVYATAGFKLEM